MILAILLLATRCDQALLSHVYRPRRLVVLAKCVTITGTVVSYRREEDGDVHIRVRPDPQFRHLLNHRNYGNMVVEPICVYPGNKARLCEGLTNTVKIPKRGSRVSVTGQYVRDTSPNHHWNELHPVTEIRTLRGRNRRSGRP